MSRLGLSNRLASANQKKTVGADEDMFLQAFEDTPKLEISTAKDLECEFIRTVAIISNLNAEWDKRVDAIKRFRSLINCGMADDSTLRTLEIPFQNNITDLRSQVVRETCITLAFLSCRLQQKFSRMAEVLFPSLIKLIPNSAKIMSTSASVAIKFIIQSTHNSRLIPIIRYQLSNSKSKEIHRALCEVVERIVHVWPANILERHLNDLQEVIKLGICDSDEQARIYARKAFNGFADIFREHAEQLYNSLDLQRQRMLNSENNLTSMSNHGSTNSVNSNHNTMSSSSSSAATLLNSNHNFNQHSQQVSSYQQNLRKIPQRVPTTTTASTSSSTASSHSQQPSSLTSGSVENIYGFTSRLQKISQSRIATGPTSIGVIPKRLPTSGFSMNPPQSPYSQAAINQSRKIAAAGSPSYSERSTSAIDVAAQRRAKARANYLTSMYNRPRQLIHSTVGSGASAASSRISPPNQYQQGHQTSSTSNHSNVSHQPASLIMTSPTCTATAVANVLSTPGVTVRSSRCRVSQSQPGSRSTSPSSRYNYITNSGHKRRSGIPVSTSRSTSPNGASLRDTSDSYYATPHGNIISNNFCQDADSDLPLASLANLTLSSPNSNSNTATITATANNHATINSYSNNHPYHHYQQSNGQAKQNVNNQETGLTTDNGILGGDVGTDNAAVILSAQKATQYLKSLINGTNSSNSNNGITINNGSTEAAIKFLTKLIEHQSPSVVLSLLDEIMPSLIIAYDNPEAAVRKEAVFAMVAIYGKVGGEKMEPHLSNLSFSKRKLLFVYIEKSNKSSWSTAATTKSAFSTITTNTTASTNYSNILSQNRDNYMNSNVTTSNSGNANSMTASINNNNIASNDDNKQENGLGINLVDI